MYQYVIIKVILTVSTFILVLTNTYGVGEMSSAEHGYVYVTVTTNISQLVSLFAAPPIRKLGKLVPTHIPGLL